MLNDQALQKIKSLADEVSRREGCMLYDLEFQGSGTGRTLRIFIDAEGTDVSVDQCANVSRGLSLLLDVENLIPGAAYELEVSSPGIERTLREPWHFHRAVGKRVKVVTLNPVEGLKGSVMSVAGELRSADEAGIVVDMDGQEARVPYVNVKRAQTVYSFQKNEKR